MGIAQGIETLGLNSMELAIRYLLVGLLMNFIGGWITDLLLDLYADSKESFLAKVELSVD